MVRALHYGLQPVMLIVVLTAWAFHREAAGFVLAAVVGVQLTLGVLEHYLPARPDWRIDARQRWVHIAAFAVLGAGIELVRELYAFFLATPLEGMRATWGAGIWPHDWPLLAQLLLVFFVSEFFWYWLHRAEHRWPLVWRLSGHGAHHSFKKLGALNSGLNHPFEFLLLVAPSATIELVFGVGGAASGAGILLLTQASIAHANLDLNCRGIGWLFTTNRHHIHHHSVVLDESNTNYGCAAIVWDRLFGTFADAPTAETGTGATEPTLWGKAVMPFFEPEDTATAPSS